MQLGRFQTRSPWKGGTTHAGRGIQSNVYGDTDLSKVDEPVSARVVQLESRERELLELVQNQERMLRCVPAPSSVFKPSHTRLSYQTEICRCW